MISNTAVIALGSNLNNPKQQIKTALQIIAGHPQIELLRTSSLYITAPVGYADQPDFINAVCIVSTRLDAEQLLAVLNSIESSFGRERSFRNAPRTLDLDIIDYNGESGSTPCLTLPHPRAHERSFVMRPLAEIAPDFRLGNHGRAADLAERLGSGGIAVTEAAPVFSDGRKQAV
ncbi:MULTISPECIES: 2-amino-4-hydroxy-6-hydroxymethyldihydropteridine diphosphokinase [Neisseria]|uniref:2-amino-4-hydroxy-6-hydroxymethyldihydropteridine pyrophosphokinase n=1 Tax=Neisseria musculi TaxID=1815583 RepID=A0A7H1MB14_9NEIS|nr:MULTISPECIES: 2-amino-4-hydroxy-6-hydroxymethyldihydropteridine diphosphokinase [Neisseria]MBF0803076.1 2-amino-4-hydroxy-6-hydroxymethyldihydropteridine diphosphokinase [Neisseria sp. 19428wB4_WF04]QNT58829.1 2-amino-4-hydroxy-6-hydroxymethyldihydropteridine diphosphokinase [Neisseria musculi]TFU44367.1 2-amino-4-hydroxy-6-hydroxymethyldihydropteridine diphosphokinase [Neisseria sp. WF04]